MNQFAKTACFVGVAIVLTAAAYLSRPAVPAKVESQVIGSHLFSSNFKKPDDVASLKVLQYDQKDSKSLALEVAKIDNLWVIPSHGKYPADAKEHLADAANALIDLKVLGLAPGFDPGSKPLDPETKRQKYNLYGVVDPDPENVKASDTGVGTRITMKNAKGEELASAIIGKTLPEQSNQCYLRESGKDPVYIVALDPNKVSVHFSDWIERNLLNLNSMDLKQVRINNYTIDQMLDPRDGQMVLARSPSGEFLLDLPSGDQPWKLADELEYDRKSHKMVSKKMAPDEEVNTTALDALKSALEDLKIVDVERKPAQVPADLHVGKLDEDTLETLAMRGFFVAGDPDDPKSPREVYSKSGEIDLQMNDGARYILRFGRTKGESSAAEAAKRNKGDVKTDSAGMDRYLFVAAEFNQDAIPKPAVEALPPEEKQPPKPAEKSPEASKANEPKKDAADASKKDGEKKDAVKPAEAAKDAKKDDAKKDDAKKDDKQKDDSGAEVVEAAKRAELRKAEQVRIDKENQRRKDEYDAKVVKGKKHVADLNDRFAQWYYVIPGDVYDKIHLDRKAIVKKKEPPKTDHEHEHDHDHDHASDLPVGPAGAINKLPEIEKAPQGAKK